MKNVYLLLFFVCSVWAAPSFAQLTISEQWSIHKTFLMPESAAYDPATKTVFVSNVNHYAKDGNGFVSQVSADGELLALKWLDGLSSPTGLTVRDGLLYVVDFDQLHIVSIEHRKIISSANAPHDSPSLNDVAVSSDGRVFVSGSASGSIYQLVDGRLVVWLQDKELLKHANGLFFDNEKLVFGGVKWLEFDLNTKKLIANFKEPMPTLNEIDGITSDGCDGYFITLIDDDRLWRVNPAGEAQAVSELAIKGIDIERFENRLFVPIVGGGLSVYMIEGGCS